MKEKFVLTRGKLILIILGLMAIAGVIVFVFVLKGNNIQKYKDFERELKIGAKHYVENETIELEEDEEMSVSIKKLDSEGLIFSDLKNKCKGYVIITNEENIETEKYELTYMPYIKCGNRFMTVNYTEE